MRFACCISKATTQTHTQNIEKTLIAFPLRLWLQERASMLLYVLHRLPFLLPETPTPAVGPTRPTIQVLSREKNDHMRFLVSRFYFQIFQHFFIHFVVKKGGYPTLLQKNSILIDVHRYLSFSPMIQISFPYKRIASASARGSEVHSVPSPSQTPSSPAHGATCPN